MACSSRLAASLVSSVTAAVLATSLAAQCGLAWLPGPGANGPYGTVYAILELPNGDLVAGGSFAIADSGFVNNIARWDGTTWLPFGAGVDGPVHALARLPNGDIVAGGAFTTAGGQPANRIALWNGSSWAPLAPGLDDTVFALLVLPNGNLVAGGRFHNAGATPAPLVAQWNGASWSVLGSLLYVEVRSLVRIPNGDIVAGGNIYQLQGGLFYGLMRFDGASWQPVPGLDPGATSASTMVNAVMMHPNGDLLAAGSMHINSVPTSVVRWNGIVTQSLNAPAWGAQALIARANGDVWIVAGPATAPGLYRWDGTGWNSVAGGPPRVTTFAEDSSGRLLAGSDPVSPVERAVTRFDGLYWQTIGAPTPPPPNVRVVVRMPNGDVVVGGSFTSFGGVAADNLARWNGSAWSPLGLGVDGPVSTLAAAPNGDLVVGGTFNNAGGAPANRVARWNGQVWSALGGGLALQPFDLAAGANGEVLAGQIGVMRFDGLTWGPLALPSGWTVLALASLPNGSFALGGLFPGTGTGVALASGGTTAPLPGGPSPVRQLLADSRGGLVAHGTVTQRWDGTTWTPLPSIGLTSLGSLGELPTGELIASGPFSSIGGGAASSIYRLRSSGWESFGDVRGSSSTTSPVVVTASGRGDVLVGGPVQSAGNVVSIGVAHAQPTCPAAVSIVGSGCTGGAGPVTLVANNLPWVGGVFTATANGMTTNSLAAQALGSSAPALRLPGGAPGCTWFVAPIVSALLVPSGGTATSTWAVPASPSLAGFQVRLQVVGVELGSTGIVQLTSTDALELTIGML
ncbi:MAG TPA: WD40 repeat domain-containing protein [Planctomycetota bacterium]|nr:WD40 repeat domain-containing protein [Planctomycetota bacterium]